MKKILPSLIAFIVLFGATTVVLAQSYTPLAPLPGTVTEGADGIATTDMGLYISGAIKLIIALGAALAFLFAIIGGTKYVAASINPAAKADALESLQHALIGLAIILSSYLILNSINPKLVSFNLFLEPVTTKTLERQQGQTEPLPLNAAEEALRGQLRSGGVYVQRVNACEGIPYQEYISKYNDGCTTIDGLPEAAISGVLALKESCGKDCNVLITGGAELGHATHGQGKAQVDLAMSSLPLNAHIVKSQVPKTNQPCGVSSALHYYVGGATYVNEQTHWHVCY